MPTESTPDVLVIGAGIIGASAAWRLAQNGLSVTLVDAGEFSGESSRAGAGMLAPGGEFGGNSRWSHLAIESRRLYPAFVEELESESGERIGLRLCGALDLARGEDEWNALIRRAGAQMVRSEVLSHWEVMKRAPRLAPRTFDQALFYPDDGIIDPTEVAKALRVALTRRGVEIVENLEITGIDAAAGIVMADSRRFEPGAVVVSAGAWSSALLPSRLPQSTPVKGHLIGYSLEPGFLDPVIRRGHTYLLQRSSGFLIAGATTEHAGFDRTVDPRAGQDLHHAAGEYVPDLLERAPDRAWIGFRPGAIRGGEVSPEPVVKRLKLPDGSESDVWLAYGHYRNGILLAPVTAKLLAGEIVTDTMAIGSFIASSKTG